MVAAVAAQAGRGLAAVAGGRAEGPVQRHPAHHLGVDVVPRRAAGLPDAVVRLVPAGQHGAWPSGPAAPSARPPASPGDSLSAWISSAIGPKTSSWTWWSAALPIRTGRDPAYPGRLSMMASVDSGAPVTEYSGCSHSGPGALRQDPAQPPEEPVRLHRGAQIHQGIDGHGAVTQPAVAVIPVAGAADALRQGRGGGREHGAGGLMDQRAQHQRRAPHQGRLHGRQRTGPAPSGGNDARRRPCGPLRPSRPACRGSVSPQRRLRTTGPCCRLTSAVAVACRPSEVMAKLTSGRQQDDGVGRADDVKLAAACLHAERRIGVVRPGRENDPCRARCRTAPGPGS